MKWVIAVVAGFMLAIAVNEFIGYQYITGMKDANP